MFLICNDITVENIIYETHNDNVIKDANINDQGNHIKTEETNQAFRLSAESRNALEQITAADGADHVIDHWADHGVDHGADQISDLYDEENTKRDGIIDTIDYEYTTTDFSTLYESNTLVSNEETTENYIYDESTYDYGHGSTDYEPFENFETTEIPQEIDFKFRSGVSKNKNSKKSSGKTQGFRDISVGTNEIQKKQNTIDTSKQGKLGTKTEK